MVCRKNGYSVGAKTLIEDLSTYGKRLIQGDSYNGTHDRFSSAKISMTVSCATKTPA
jgi:hypothetical protein